MRKRLRRGHHDFCVFGGMTLRCYPDSTSASSVIYCNESPDYHEMHFVRHYLRPGDRVLDVGANIGVYSLLAASRIGCSGHIVAIEPGPTARRRLLENIQINRLTNIDVHECAVGENSGTVSFLCDQDTTNRMQTSADEDQLSVSVPIARLDDLVKIECALGKMDIEGAEPVALKGAMDLLNKANPPVWLLELNGSLHAYGYTETKFAEWLAKQGYDLGLYDADRGELNFSNPQPWVISPNVLAVARCRKAQVAERCGARLVEA